MPRLGRKLPIAIALLALCATIVACGDHGVQTAEIQPDLQRGADLFAEKCAGCHTLDIAGTQGSAEHPNDSEIKDGPNFNFRSETKDQVLYAIRNGGFSSGPMPQNIVVGEDAEAVAAFVAKYAGSQKPIIPSPKQTPVGQSTPTPAPSPAPAAPASTPTATATATPTATPTPTPSATPTPTQTATAADGKQVFTTTCAGCHTLADAGTHGTVGPNLDQLKPSEALVQTQVTNGGGGMPAFKGQLTDQQIKAVAQYVSSVAGK
jgi:mono/diheme cytochrome c family protein